MVWKKVIVIYYYYYCHFYCLTYSSRLLLLLILCALYLQILFFVSKKINTGTFVRWWWWGQWHRKKLHINAIKIRQYNHINKLRLFFFFSFLSLWEISNKYNLDIAYKKKEQKIFFFLHFPFVHFGYIKFYKIRHRHQKNVYVHILSTMSHASYGTCWLLFLYLFFFVFKIQTWQTNSLGRKMFTF